MHTHDEKHEFTLIVNAEPKKWEKKEISFQEIVVLAFGTYIDNPDVIYTVGYTHGPKENPKGSMVKGQTVFVKNEMQFVVKMTNKS
jgi:hypothetical protein